MKRVKCAAAPTYLVGIIGYNHQTSGDSVRLRLSYKTGPQKPKTRKVGPGPWLSLLSLSLLLAVLTVPDAQARGATHGHKTSKTGNVKAAAKTALPAAGAHGSANVALLAQGAKLHKEGRIEEAEAIFKEVLIHDPQSVDAFYDLGAIAEGRGDLISALSHYHAALSLRPGDKDLKEAVSSVEKALKKNSSELAGKKASPLSLSPENKGEPLKETASGSASASASVITPQNSDNIEGLAPTAADLPVLSVTPAQPQEDGLPVLSVPQAESEEAPRVVDAKTFQLSSRKGEVITPGLGISQDQFPDIPLGVRVKGAAANNCPPPVLAVGQNQRSAGSQRMRQAASLIIMVGAGAALNASGLHCPVCHMMRFRF